METRAYYEKKILEDIRKIPEDSLPDMYSIFSKAIDIVQIKYHMNIKDSGSDNRLKRNEKTGHRKAGFAKGTFVIKKGFDEPLDDFREYM